MSAAARAASVAPDTAMPQSAFFSAGASLTPSPVIPTMWPRFCSTSTMWYLCSGKTWAKPSAVSMDSATAAVSFFFASPRPAASRMLVPNPTLAAVSFAMASASPVTILTVTPIAAAVAMVAAASSRGGSNSGSTPTNCQSPSPSRAGHAQRPEAAGGEIVRRRLSAAALICAALAASARMTCGAPLVTLKVVPSAAVTVASVRLCTGSNG